MRSITAIFFLFFIFSSIYSSNSTIFYLKKDFSGNLRKAINHISSIKKEAVIIVEPGEFYISGGIELPSNITIQGFGNISKIIQKDKNSKENLLYAIEKENIKIDNLSLKNSGKARSESYWFPGGTFDSVGSCLLFAGCKNISVTNNYISKGGNNKNGNGIGNVYFSCCMESKIDNNFIEDGDNGICVDTWYNKLEGKIALYNNAIVITKNIISNVLGRGITIENRRDKLDYKDILYGSIVVSNNTITKFGYAAIQGNSPYNCLITSNVIDGSSQKSRKIARNPKKESIFGIEISSLSKNFSITNNIIHNVSSQGIRVLGVEKNVKINNNNIYLDNDNINSSGIFVFCKGNDISNITVNQNSLNGFSNGIVLKGDKNNIYSSQSVIGDNNISTYSKKKEIGIHILNNIKDFSIINNTIQVKNFGWSMGFRIDNSSNIILKNNFIKKSTYGYFFKNVNNILITDGIVKRCLNGIKLVSSSSVTLLSSMFNTLKNGIELNKCENLFSSDNLWNNIGSVSKIKSSKNIKISDLINYYNDKNSVDKYSKNIDFSSSIFNKKYKKRNK